MEKEFASYATTSGTRAGKVSPLGYIIIIYKNGYENLKNQHPICLIRMNLSQIARVTSGTTRLDEDSVCKDSESALSR